MFKKIVKFIIDILTFIINWFKEILKKDDKVNIKESKRTKEVSNKPKGMIIKGIIDAGASVLGGHNYNSEYHEVIPEDVDLEIKDFIKKMPSMTSLEQDKKIKDFEKVLSILSYKESTKKSQTKKDAIKHDKNVTLIKKEQNDIKEIKKNISKDNINDNVNDLVENNEVKDDIKDNTISTNEKEEVEVIDMPTITPKKDFISPEKNKYEDYIKNANKTLKEAKTSLKDVEEELKLNYDKLDNYKFIVEDIKQKISKIKKEYYYFRNSDEYYKIADDFNMEELDKFEIIKSDEQIDLYLNKCNSILQKIEDKKYTPTKINTEVSTKKEEKSKKKTKSTTLEEQPNVAVPKVLIEIEQASKFIKNDIREEEKEVIKINSKLDALPPYERKTKRLGFFDNFLSNTFKIGLSLLPLKIFKNRMLGFTVTGFMLNNRIRSMRKIINKDLTIEYSELNRRIKNQIDIINSYDTICNDSLYQISCLKNEFGRMYGYDLNNEEVKRIFGRIMDLEDDINKQKNNLHNTKLKLNKNIKIKKLRRY